MTSLEDWCEVWAPVLSRVYFVIAWVALAFSSSRPVFGMVCSAFGLGGFMLDHPSASRRHLQTSGR